MRGRYREFFEYLSLIAQLGLTIVVAILLGFYGGQWLDDRLGTDLIFTIVGLLAGLGAGFRSAYEIMKGILARDTNKDGQK